MKWAVIDDSVNVNVTKRENPTGFSTIPFLGVHGKGENAVYTFPEVPPNKNTEMRSTLL